MKSATQFVSKTLQLAFGAVAFASSFLAPAASAQAPYLLPYTMQTFAGGVKETRPW